MQVHSYFVSEIRAEPITIEFSARFQIPGFQILGLPAPEIQEARERIMSAFQASSLEFPQKRVLVNLAPASVRKSGTGHDLAIALKILSENLSRDWPERIFARGELGLDGAIRPGGKMAHLIDLLLSLAEAPTDPGPVVVLGPEDHHEFLRLLSWRRKQGLRTPRLQGLARVVHLADLPDQLEQIFHPLSLNPEPDLGDGATDSRAAHEGPPLSLLPLTAAQERIVKIASIGRHHCLILGPKGVGKSVSLDWFKALAAPLDPLSAWERALFSETRSEPPCFEAPIRQVHSQVRPAHLLGSFRDGFRAGELSLAHGGMLFADEFPEWPRDAKECLREPLQREQVRITRVRGTFEAKCDLQLIASGNLCPCGGIPALFRSLTSNRKASCRCPDSEVRKYLARLSGPILDRIDMIALFSSSEPPSAPRSTPTASTLQDEVSEAREWWRRRHSKPPSKLSPRELEKLIDPSPPLRLLLSEIQSLRSRHKLMRVACSISALEKSEEVKEAHLLEAKTYRFLDY